jgi:hypothetical protein
MYPCILYVGSSVAEAFFPEEVPGLVVVDGYGRLSSLLVFVLGSRRRSRVRVEYGLYV